MELWSFLSEQDLPDWFGRATSRRLLCVLRALPRIPRAVGLLRRSTVVVVQREALPFGPALLEALAARMRPIVWDVDDAVWEEFESPTAGRVPQWVRATAGKYRWLCRNASEVWAGSEILAQWCRRHSDAVTVIPTVVPVSEVLEEPSHENVAGWVGSHSTGRFLERVLPALAQIERPPDVIVVGAKVRPPEGLHVSQMPWSQQAEDLALKSMRVGLYPVDRDHPLAEGKCGLKAILYMAAGIPPVVTPTTTNAAIVRHGIEGLHAETYQEWLQAVHRLLSDDELWARCSRAAHRRALWDYSLQRWGPVVAGRLHGLVKTAQKRLAAH